MILKNKISLITGCNGGIGLSLLKKFSETGSDIICCTRKKNDSFEDEIIKITNITIDVNIIKVTIKKIN